MLERVWRKGKPVILLVWECKLIQPLWEMVWKFLKKWHKTTIWPRNPTPRHIPWENQIEKDTCIPLFIASLFTIARTRKQPRCPSTDEWNKEAVVHIYNEILLIHKKECIWVSSKKKMNLESIIQSEVSQKEKNKYHILMHIYEI